MNLQEQTGQLAKTTHTNRARLAVGCVPLPVLLLLQLLLPLLPLPLPQLFLLLQLLQLLTANTATTATPTVTVTTAATVTAAATATTATAATVNATTAPTIATLIATVTAAAATTATTVTATAVAAAITDKANQAWIKSYLHVVKRAATVALQAEMGEGERDLLPSWQLDHIDTLAVVGIIIGPVGGDDYAVSVGEGTTTSRVAYNKTQSTPRT